MSLIELARLSEPQLTALASYGECWARLRLSTEPVDRAAAEAGVREAYAAADLPPPRRIVWGESPLEIANAWARCQHIAGQNLRFSVVDQVRRKAETAVDRAVGLTVRMALAEEPRLRRAEPFCSSIDDAVTHTCAEVRPQLRWRLARMFAFPRLAAALSFATSSVSLRSIASLGALEYFHDACSMRRQTEAVAGLWEIAKNADWIIPHEDVCWLSERPSLIQCDATGRLHSAQGPALAYRDGWTLHAWKGINVPSWIIERPDTIDVRAISAATDPQVRRCMIDVFTPARFIADGGAYRVSQDETGVLWRQRWRWEAWAAVEVVNGTPEPDGTYKHHFLQVPATVRTAREAVAWTYGLPEQRYRPVVRT